MADDVDGAKRGAAVLAACIVQTLTETDPSFQERFLHRLAQAHAERRADGGLDELEVLAWTRTLLTGFDFASGQGKPFLS